MPTTSRRHLGDRATPSASLASFPIIGEEGNDTTHLSTLDSDGSAVALTYTLEEGYGAKAVVAGARGSSSTTKWATSTLSPATPISRAGSERRQT